MIEAIINPNRRESYPNVQYIPCDSLMRYAGFLGFGEIHTKIDEKTGLRAIVAIHNLTRGPAIGGCRMITYHTVGDAYEDVIRLAHMMSFKSAINNLPHGGAKAVLIKPREMKSYNAYFEKFGEFIDNLGGRYIAAVDSGTGTREMDLIGRKTTYVTCTTASGADSDPSPLTALGVRRAIQSAVKFKFNRESIEGIHVAIQGAGQVGYYLAKELHALGATLTMSDVNERTLQRCVDEFQIKISSPDTIYDVKADVFAPCALGAVLNMHSIKRLKVSIVAGSANNQLAHYRYGALLHELGILYAPDFLINAGGLIHVAVTYARGDMKESLAKINDIYDKAYDIFERAKRENIPTNEIAEAIAKERLK